MLRWDRRRHLCCVSHSVSLFNRNEETSHVSCNRDEPDLTRIPYVAVYNMEGHIYFGASTEQERDSWMHAFTGASIENLKRTAEELRARLALAQDAPLPPIAQSNGDESEQLLITFD